MTKLLKRPSATQGACPLKRNVNRHERGLVTPVELRLPQGAVRLFSTVTTLGTPLDITLQELRIESFHAVDEDSKAIVRALLGGP